MFINYQDICENKTPGSDSLTAEFYLCFWKYGATPLVDYLNDAFQLCSEMSVSLPFKQQLQNFHEM